MDPCRHIAVQHVLFAIARNLPIANTLMIAPAPTPTTLVEIDRNESKTARERIRFTEGHQRGLPYGPEACD